MMPLEIKKEALRMLQEASIKSLNEIEKPGGAIFYIYHHPNTSVTQLHLNAKRAIEDLIVACRAEAEASL